MSVNRRWLPVAVPGLLMLGLGLFEATRPVLSWDEVATADVAHRTTAQIGDLLPHIDGVFGPYYLLVHVWTAVFGASVLSLRLPSILAMAGAAALTGELGRRLFGVPAGLRAGLLLALVPNMSRYAAEARPYAMVGLFSVLALLLLHRVLERPGPGRWAWYGLAMLAVGLCSIVAMAMLAGHLGVLLSRRRALLLPWILVALVVLVALTPLIWWGLHQRAAQLHWMTPLTLGMVVRFPARLAGSAAVAGLLIVLFLRALLVRARAVADTAVAALAPAAVVLAVSATGTSFWVIRYLLYVLIPAAVVAAAGLTRPAGDRRRWPVRAAALVVFAAAAVPGQVAVRQPNVKNGSDYRALAGLIRQRQRAGDDIVLQKGRQMRAGLDYYLRGDRGRPRDVLESRPASRTGTLVANEYPDPSARLATATRIWLVVGGTPTDPASGRPDLSPLLRHGFERAARWRVDRGTLALYIRRSAPVPSG